LVQKAIVSGERETQTFSGIAVVPSSQDPQAPVLSFQVTLSVKKRRPKKA
jgi:hypothetical protein